MNPLIWYCRCGHEIEFYADWEDYMTDVVCPTCKKRYVVDCDEHEVDGDWYEDFWLREEEG